MSLTRNSNKLAKRRVAAGTVSVAVALLLGGAAPLAVAQSTPASFAETFARMQALSSNSSNFQREAPALRTAPVPRVALSGAEMQALSSDSPVWRIDHGAAEFGRGPTFAQTHPRGLSFSQYQAYASNSDEFALPSSAGMPSVATTDGVNVAGRTAPSTSRGL